MQQSKKWKKGNPPLDSVTNTTYWYAYLLTLQQEHTLCTSFLGLALL